MADKNFLNLSGLESFLAKLKITFATYAQGTKADEAYAHAESAHAPSNAERNVIVGIKRNGSDLTPDSSRKVNITVPTKVSELSNDSGYKTTDHNTTYSLTKSGSTIKLTGSDGSETSVADSNTTYQNATTSADGLMSSEDKTKLNGIATGANKYTLPTASSSTLGGVKTTSTVTSTSGLTPCPIISGIPYYKDTNTTYSLSSFGITATATELNKLDGVTATKDEINFLDGVTSAIQTQLNGKAASSHTHNYAGSSSAGGAANSVKASMIVKLNGGSTEGTNMFTFNGSAAKTINITPSDIGAAASSHNHSAANITSGTLAVGRGGTGITSNPSMLINLASTSAASVFATSPRPGVTGTLPIARGGTGGTSAASARLQLGAVNIICSETEPTGQNVGDIWLQEL